MAIEERVLSSLQSAVQAGSLDRGEVLDTPYVINRLDGVLMDCNDLFRDLVGKQDLHGTHYKERCPSDAIKRITDQVYASIESLGFARSQKPMLTYDGKIHDVSYEAQLVAVSGKAFVLASLTIEALDIGQVSNTSKTTFSLF